MPTAAQLTPYAQYTLPEAVIPELPSYYRGKVRENYDLPDGRRILIASDRLSAFDMNLAVIPFKGQVLTQIARFWFDQTRDICPNHVLEYPDPNALLCQRLKMMPVEIVARDYLAGSTSTAILTMYKKGQRNMYGHAFAGGMRDNQKLPQTILTPTTKAAHGDHDAPLSASEVVSLGLLNEKQWQEVSAIALALFARGREVAARRGLILVDTKYEFGFDEAGKLAASPGCAATAGSGTEGDAKIVLADEIHTPDSSRYWLADTYAQRFEKTEPPDTLDKDFIRRWVSSRCDPYKDKIPEIPQEIILEAAATYIRVFEQITGQSFPLPDPGTPPLARIRANLKKYFTGP